MGGATGVHGVCPACAGIVVSGPMLCAEFTASFPRTPIFGSKFERRRAVGAIRLPLLPARPGGVPQRHPRGSHLQGDSACLAARGVRCRPGHVCPARPDGVCLPWYFGLLRDCLVWGVCIAWFWLWPPSPSRCLSLPVVLVCPRVRFSSPPGGVVSAWWRPVVGLAWIPGLWSPPPICAVPKKPVAVAQAGHVCV